MTSGHAAAPRPVARLFSLALALAGGACMVAAPRPAMAQQAPTRIAVVNVGRVVSEMEERKVLQTELENDQKRADATSRDKAAAIQKLQKERDDAFAPNSPQFEQASDQLMQMTAEYKVWAETEKLRAERKQKRQHRNLFDHVQAAVAKVATRDAIDLVIADTSERLPEDIDRIPFADLRALIMQKDVLFKSARPGLDITDAVILMVNADYKKGGAAAPAPAPAPAP